MHGVKYKNHGTDHDNKRQKDAEQKYALENEQSGFSNDPHRLPQLTTAYHPGR